MVDTVSHIDVFEFNRPNEAYLGDVGSKDRDLGPNHIVRHFNGTVYPKSDRSVVIKLTDSSGAVGWGETYGLVAPGAIVSLIDELIGPYLKSTPLARPDLIWDELYNLQRNRGYWGGYLADTLAAIDIALWDLQSRKSGMSIQAILGGKGSGKVPAYVSGLPGSTTEERVEKAKLWKGRGYDALKIPISATDKGNIVGEFEALREELGDNHKLAIDLHWTKSSDETLELEQRIRPYDPWFIEAPTRPEDIESLRKISNAIETPIAIGEEWRTEWDYRSRQDICDIIQPEMGHTGITQFMRLAKLAKSNQTQIMPHATIGLGIFMAASLRASIAVGVTAHEFQHTIYGRNAQLLTGAAPCESGFFSIPDTLGHGVVPNDDAFQFLQRIND